MNQNTADIYATYDARGNVTQTSAGATFAYDGTDVVKASTFDGANHLYVYTAGDERIGTITSVSGEIVRSDWTVRDPAGKVLRRFSKSQTGTWTWEEDYIYRDGQLLAAEVPRPEKTLHFHLDHLGTPRLITGNGGAQIALHTYYPFGTELTSPAQDPEALKFTGHQRDAASLDYMHARYYNAVMGRFLSVDPVLDVKTALSRPQSWNRYAYVMNNPVRFTDPTGKYTCSGTAEQCKQIEAGIENVRKAALTALAEGQRGAARLLNLVAFYGKAGENNGVSIVLGDRQGYGAAGTKTTSFLGLFKTTTIKVDSDYLSRMANGGAAGAVKLAETMAHEGGHGIFQRAFGMTNTRADVKREEIGAYATEAGVNEAFHVDNSHGIWTNRVGWRPASIEYWAEESTRAWAGEPPLVPQN